MLTVSLLLATALTPQGQGSSTAPIVINEFSYDDTGGNDRVFVELYNRTTGPVDISGWVLQGIDGTASNPSNGSVVIQSGTVLFPGDFFVVGQAAGVPNVDQDVPSMNTLLETGPDALELQLPGGFVIDSVAWEYGGWTNTPLASLEGDGLFGDLFNNDTNPSSASRVFDGYDSDSNGCDFRVARWSPGTSNDAAHTAGMTYANDFDDVVGSTVDADFSYSFVPGTTEDPATLGIPASPQGGNCSVWYDPTGGGDVNYFSSASRADQVVECYAYLRGPNAAMDTDDIETWGLGVRGSTDSFGEPPDLDGLYGYIGFAFQSGITGVAWFQIITQTTSNLYLVDFNDGGSDFTVLAGPIPIASDGWSRVRLSVVGSDVVGNLGGTFGCDDGVRYTASGVSSCLGSVYIQYRENVSAVGAHNPIALDALVIAPNAPAAVTSVGIGSPTNFGLPAIATTGAPTIGNATFSIEGSNLTPNSMSVMALNIGAAFTPGVQIPGAPAGALRYIDNVNAVTMFFMNGAGGAVSMPLAIPCDSLLTSLPIAVQIYDIDTTLAAMVPFGTSPGLSIVVGN
ncbi:MAG: lamin tail domain-containing protein [Planctomycetes bacterium]|nr:lamin tail domain-containing protein [Planctomycetota bacterium]